MTEQFYTILTNIGKASIANASTLGSKVDFKFIALGDGDGGYYNPNEVQTELKKEVWRGQVSHVVVDEDNPNWVQVSAIVPAMVGGFSIREIGMFDTEGNMLAIGKYPETYKPTAEDGSTKDLVIRMILEVSNASVVTLKIDPTVILVTKKDLEDLKDSIDKQIGNIEIPVTSVNEEKGDVVLTTTNIKDAKGKTVEERLADISTEVGSIDVPVKSVNNKTGAVTLVASDVGAVSVGRKVNNKALSADITLTASDVGSSPVGHAHAYSTLTGIPGTFPPSAHAHAYGTLTGIPGAFPPSAHAHAYSTLTGRPSTFPPSAHTHTPAQVGLGSVLNYGIATTAEAQAGASNAKYMTPFLVNAAVKHLAKTGGISMVKSVQRGFYSKSLRHSNDATASDNTVNISNINPNKSEITINCRFGGYYEDRAEQTVVKTLNNNSFVVEYGWRSGSSSADEAIRIFSWQVIEYY